MISQSRIKIVNLTELRVGYIRGWGYLLVQRKILLDAWRIDVEVPKGMVEALIQVLNEEGYQKCIVHVFAILKDVEEALASKDGE